jgi:hypothetical protein
MPVLPVTLSDIGVNRQENSENCALLGCYTASSGNSLPGAVHTGFN